MFDVFIRVTFVLLFLLTVAYIGFDLVSGRYKRTGPSHKHLQYKHYAIMTLRLSSYFWVLLIFLVIGRMLW